MKSNSLVKVCCLISSVLLVTVFVCYRAGAFERLLAPKNNGQSHELVSPDGGAPNGSNQIFYSSKSGAILVGDDIQSDVSELSSTGDVELLDTTIISGSKSAMPLFNGPVTSSQSQQAKPERSNASNPKSPSHEPHK